VYVCVLFLPVLVGVLWLCVCLPVSGFRLLWGASGWVIEMCGVFDLLVWAVTLCVFGSLLCVFDALVVFACVYFVWVVFSLYACCLMCCCCL